MAKRDKTASDEPIKIEHETPETPQTSGSDPASDEPTELSVERLRTFLVKVHKIEPATIEAVNEEAAKAAYRELRGFHKTIHPFEVRELPE